MNTVPMSDALIAVGSMSASDIEAMRSDCSHDIAGDLEAAVEVGRGNGTPNCAEKASRHCTVVDRHIEHELQMMQRRGILVGRDLTENPAMMTDAKTWIRLSELRIALREAQEFLAMEHGVLPWRGNTTDALEAVRKDSSEHALLELLRHPMNRDRILQGSDEQVVRDFVLGRLSVVSCSPATLLKEALSAKECELLLSGCTDTSHHHATTIAIARFLLAQGVDVGPAGALQRAKAGMASLIQHANALAAGVVHSTHGYRGQLWR